MSMSCSIRSTGVLPAGQFCLFLFLSAAPFPRTDAGSRNHAWPLFCQERKIKSFLIQLTLMNWTATNFPFCIDTLARKRMRAEFSEFSIWEQSWNFKIEVEILRIKLTKFRAALILFRTSEWMLCRKVAMSKVRAACSLSVLPLKCPLQRLN